MLQKYLLILFHQYLLLLLLTNSGTGSEGHFGALKTIATGGSLVNPAKTIAMGAITTVSGTLTVNGPGSVEFPDLATQGGSY